MYLSELTKEEQEVLLRQLYDECARYLGLWNVEESERGDILQVTVVRIWSRFDTLRDTGKLFPWARAILKNEVNQYYRRRKRELDHRVWPGNMGDPDERTADGFDESGHFDGLSVPEKETVWLPPEKLKDTDLYELVEGLGTPASTILLLNAVYGDTLAEIAETMCMNDSTVRTIAARSVKRIREKILSDPVLSDRYRIYIEEGRNT